MDNLFKGAYFAKSFMMIGNELNHCFGCKYCRADNKELLSFHTLPSEINPYFRNIPVAVNCFYGDPMLQINNTINLLKRLEDVRHTGPVIIITKGDISKMNSRHFNLDLHFGISTCGIGAEKYDGGTWLRFIENLNYCQTNNYQYHIEFRPIIKDLNDNDYSFNAVINQAKIHNVPIGYCGLQVSDDLKKRLAAENIEFKSYSDKGFGLKKFISKEVNDKFVSIAKNNNVDVYKKTSCIISTLNGGRDYNAHYYRPNEVGCYKCPNKETCHNYFKKHNNGNIDIDYLKNLIPFNFEVINAKNHVCSLYKNGLCGFPSHDCLNITGKLLKINEKVTTSDVRLIKWLTGFTVDAEFEEIPYISNKWIYQDK